MKNRYSGLIAISALLAGSATQAQQPQVSLNPFPTHVRTAMPHPHAPVLRGGGAPANDDCANAEPMSLSLVGECATGAVAGDNSESTTTTGDPNCDSGSGYQDVWYTFNSGDNSSIYITLTNGTMTDFAFTVATDCTFGNEIACSIGISDPTPVTVTPQTLYYVRVYSNLDYGVGGTFTLCASYIASGDAPENDLCSSVVPEALEPGSPLTFTGTTVGATVDGDYEPGSELDGSSPTVWHAFTTTTCGNISVNYCGTDPAYTNGAGFLTTNCPAANDYILFSAAADCGDGNFLITYNYVPAGTYNLPVWSDPTFAYGPYTIDVSMEACPAGYCIPNPINGPTDGDFIAGVLLGDIDNTTVGDNAYEDYTLQSTDLNQGEEYTITITGGDYAPDDYAVWIDYNNDEFFSDDEKLGQVSSIGDAGEMVSITFSVPTDAPLGTDRMRVRCVYGADDMTACTDYSYGETEDYSVNIVLSIGVSDNNKADFAVMPNPNNGSFQIHAINSGSTTIQLMDMTGRVVYSEQALLTAGSLHTLALEGILAVGTYSLRLSTEKGNTTRTVMVK